MALLEKGLSHKCADPKSLANKSSTVTGACDPVPGGWRQKDFWQLLVATGAKSASSRSRARPGLKKNNRRSD